MKLVCLQENLAKGLSIVKRVTQSRSVLPVLSNILLTTTEDGRLKLSATNLEVSLTCWIDAEIKEGGAITIPAQIFHNLVNSLPHEKVNLKLNERTQSLRVSCSQTKANIRGIDADEFPVVPETFLTGNRICVEADTLKQIISQAIIAAAADNVRPILAGVYTVIDNGEIQLTATDGFRLFQGRVSLPADSGTIPPIIIPGRALTELLRIIGDDDVCITLSENHGQIIFDMNGVSLVSQTINGNYPEVSPIIPKRHTTRTIVNTAEFLSACKMAEIFTDMDVVHVHIEPSGHITVSATNNETGDNEIRIDADVTGEPMEIDLNVKYLRDAFGVVGTPQAAIELTANREPIVIKPTDGDFLHVIMPVIPS